MNERVFLCPAKPLEHYGRMVLGFAKANLETKRIEIFVRHTDNLKVL